MLVSMGCYKVFFDQLDSSCGTLPLYHVSLWTINLSETVEYDVLHEMTTISQCVEP